MYWLAINRVPVYITTLIDELYSSNSKQALAEILGCLKRRALIKVSNSSSDDVLFTLEPLFMEYMTTRLIKESCEEILNLNIKSLLVTALIIGPALLGNHFNFFDLSFLGNSTYAQAAEGSEEGKIDVTKMVLGALAGLVLFLYGVTRMAEGLKEISGDRAKKILSKFTT